jgi:hypothetical protein
MTVALERGGTNAVAANDLGLRRSMLGVMLPTLAADGVSACLSPIILADPLVIPVDGAETQEVLVEGRGAPDEEAGAQVLTGETILVAREAVLLGTVGGERQEYRLQGDVAVDAYLAWRRLVEGGPAGEEVAKEGLRATAPLIETDGTAVAQVPILRHLGNVFDQWHAAFEPPEGHVLLRQVVAEFESGGHGGSLVQLLAEKPICLHHMHVRVQSIPPDVFFSTWKYDHVRNAAYPNDHRDPTKGFQVTLAQQDVDAIFGNSDGGDSDGPWRAPPDVSIEVSLGVADLGVRWYRGARFLGIDLVRRRVGEREAPVTVPIVEMVVAPTEQSLMGRLAGFELGVSSLGGDGQTFRTVFRRNGRLLQDLSLLSDAHGLTLNSKGTTVLSWRTDGTTNKKEKIDEG